MNCKQTTIIQKEYVSLRKTRAILDKKYKKKYYEFLRRTKQHIQFFDWFEVYSQRNGIDYPFLQTTNVVKRWQMKEKSKQNFHHQSQSLSHTNQRRSMPSHSSSKIPRMKEQSIIRTSTESMSNNQTNKNLQTRGEYLSLLGNTKYAKIQEAAKTIPIFWKALNES